MRLPLKQLGFLAFMAFGSVGLWQMRGYLEPSDIEIMAHTRGSLIHQPPTQTSVGDDLYTFPVGRATLIPEALFDIHGVVLSRKRYLFDEMSGWAPVDLAMGWGPMSDPGILGQVRVWQSGRGVAYSFPEGAILESDIRGNIANIRIIPANDEVRKSLSTVRAGDIIRMTGFLVDVETHVDYYHTSLERFDEGSGSSEILYVREVDLDPI